MIKLRVASGALAACVLLASCSNNNADTAEIDYDAFVPMKAGLWEIKLVFSDINVPTIGRSQKKQIMNEVANAASGRRCLSEAENKKPGADFFGGSGADNCRYKAFDVSGQNVKMRLSCGMDGMGSADMDLSGLMGETAFNYDSAVDVRLPMIGKVKLKGNAIGKYIGPCPAQ